MHGAYETSAGWNCGVGRCVFLVACVFDFLGFWGDLGLVLLDLYSGVGIYIVLRYGGLVVRYLCGILLCLCGRDDGFM